MERLLFETTSENTLEEFIRFNQVVARSQKAYWIYRAVVIISILVCSLYLFIKGDLYGGSIFLIVLVFIVILWRVLLTTRARKCWQSNKMMQNMVETFYFYEDHVEQISPMGNITIHYDQLYKILEDQKHFYLLIAKNQGSIVNKENCKEQLIDFIRELKISVKNRCNA